MCAGTQARMHLGTQTCSHTPMHAPMLPDTHAGTYIAMHPRMHSGTHTHTHTHIYAEAYACAHRSRTQACAHHTCMRTQEPMGVEPKSTIAQIRLIAETS